MPDVSFPRPPRGAQAIEHWARSRGVSFSARPDESWFRRWEPYDTLAPPSFYFNACTVQHPPGLIVLAEPWTSTSEDTEPLERTVLGFATHPALVRRASMRAGEHFITRVAFLESLPPPTVKVGDKVWDTHVVTFAASPLEAATAFHPKLRQLLSGWGFQGHLELRPGGLVCHFAGLGPIPEHYSRMRRILIEIVAAAVAYPRS
jgi:hypothetical protein